MSEISRLHAAFCEYSLVFKGNTPRTIKWYKENLRYFVHFTNVETVAQINQRMLEEYLLTGRAQRN